LIYFEDFLPHNNVAQMTIFWNMLRSMENVLKVKARCICLAEEWSLSSPKEAAGMALNDFLAPEVFNAQLIQWLSADVDVDIHVYIRLFVLEES
jgi:hypothetical protein